MLTLSVLIQFFERFQESELNPENRRNPNSKSSNGLTTLNLRANRLKGHIILGNYSVSIILFQFFAFQFTFPFLEFNAARCKRKQHRNIRLRRSGATPDAAVFQELLDPANAVWKEFGVCYCREQ